MSNQPDELKTVARLSRLKEDAKLLCWHVAENLAINMLGEDLSCIGAKTATMNLIEEGRMMLVITGPNFEPELFTVNEEIQSLFGLSNRKNESQ